MSSNINANSRALDYVGAEKLMTSARIGEPFVSSIFADRVTTGERFATSARNRYVIDIGLVVANVSTASSPRGNNDR